MKSKILIIGLPLFIVQLVVVYFITANVLISQGTSNSDNSPKKEETQEESKDTSADNIDEKKSSDNSEKKDENKSSDKSAGEFLFTIEDIICNPAETNGKILVLTSLGFELNDAESKKKMEEKTIILKDIIINNISRKTVSELTNVAKRDSLKIQIIQNIESKIPNVKIKELYFSKFIIQ
jgi:flagellar FliL protein